MNEFPQPLTGSSLCNPESLKAFGQMYNSQAACYGGGSFFKDDKQYSSVLPFLAQHFTYPSATSSSFSPTSSSSSGSSSSQQTSKKKPVPVPDSQKDESYYERRARNNAAAKKSRESKRRQDTDNEVRVKALAEENMWLRAYIDQLRAYINQLSLVQNAQSGTTAGFPAFDTTTISGPTVPGF